MIGGKLIGGLLLLVVRIGFIKGNEGSFLAVAEEEMADFVEESEPKYIGSSSAGADCYQGFLGCEPFADAVSVGSFQLGEDDEGDAAIGARLL